MKCEACQQDFEARGNYTYETFLKGKNLLLSLKVSACSINYEPFYEVSLCETCMTEVIRQSTERIFADLELNRPINDRSEILDL